MEKQIEMFDEIESKLDLPSPLNAMLYFQLLDLRYDYFYRKVINREAFSRALISLLKQDFKHYKTTDGQLFSALAATLLHVDHLSEKNIRSLLDQFIWSLKCHLMPINENDIALKEPARWLNPTNDIELVETYSLLNARIVARLRQLPDTAELIQQLERNDQMLQELIKYPLFFYSQKEN